MYSRGLKKTLRQIGCKFNDNAFPGSFPPELVHSNELSVLELNDKELEQELSMLDHLLPVFPFGVKTRGRTGSIALAIHGQRASVQGQNASYSYNQSSPQQQQGMEGGTDGTWKGTPTRHGRAWAKK